MVYRGLYLAIIEWGWVGYEEFCRSRRVLSTEAEGRGGYNPPRSVEFFKSDESRFHSKYFLPLKRAFAITLFVFPLTKYNTTPSPGFLGQRFNNLQRAALFTSFWRHRFNNFRRAALLTSLIAYGEDSFQIWWTAAGYGELCVWF